MEWNEIFAAIVTSLIASVVFWLVFNEIPNAVERRKIKPLLDFDLYQLYSKLAHFLELPLYHSIHSPSFIQQRLYMGELKLEDYRLYLATKCLTEDHKKVDETAKHLMPIGDSLKAISNELLEMIQKLYVFNNYLNAEQILLCRKIADKVTIYDFGMRAFEQVGNQMLAPVDPSMRGMEKMFYESYLLFLQLQDLLIKQKPTENTLGDFYKVLNFRKIGLLYSQGNYKKVAGLAKKDSNTITKAFFFRSLLRNGETEHGLEALRDFLKEDKLRLIYMRDYFKEFIDDETIMNELIEDRSEKEYKEMMSCIIEEKERQKSFEQFAEQMDTFYANKLKK